MAGAGQQPYGGADQEGDDSSASGGFDTAQGSGQQGDLDFSEQGGGGPAGSSMEHGGGSPAGSGTEQGGGLPSAASHEEQVAILHRQLEGSMSEYDGMILRERRNILNRGGEAGSEQQVETFDRDIAYYDEGDPGGGGDENQPGFDAAGAGGTGGDDQAPELAQAGGNPYGSAAGGPGRANDRAYAPPGDIPSGDDDDVVARQIREAAMYEEDPELREKLWDEYRKYKGQTR